jgi:hypothetical protein
MDSANATPEHENWVIATRAILELTDAHVAPAAADAWEDAVAFLRDETDEGAPLATDAVVAVVEQSALLA